MKLHQQHGRPRRAWFGLITGMILLLLAQGTVGGTLERSPAPTT